MFHAVATQSSKEWNASQKQNGYVYDTNWLQSHYTEIKQRCRENRIVFLVGQNDLRYFGDYVDCCVGDSLIDFNGNKYNLNYFPPVIQHTGLSKATICEPYTGGVFKSVSNNRDWVTMCRTTSYYDILQDIVNRVIFGNLEGKG